MITTNITEVIAAMNGVITRMRNPQPVLDRVASQQASKVLLSIMSDKKDPDGRKWADWMPSTRTQRQRKGNADLGLLWDRGDLLQSIDVNITSSGFQIGTNAEHAEYLQSGTRRMKARPFLGWSARDMQSAERAVRNYIEGGL